MPKPNQDDITDKDLLEAIAYLNEQEVFLPMNPKRLRQLIDSCVPYEGCYHSDNIQGIKDAKAS